MNRFNKIVAEIKSNEAARQRSLANAARMFVEARAALQTLREIKFSVPQLDQRDGDSRYALLEEIQDGTIIVLRHDSKNNAAAIACCSSGGSITIVDENELFKVANHLMADT